MLLPWPLIPCVGSRIALSQDKQLELAHVVYIVELFTYLLNNVKRVQYTPRGRFGCVSFETWNLRDSHTKDNVRKRPYNKKS